MTEMFERVNQHADDVKAEAEKKAQETRDRKEAADDMSRIYNYIVSEAEKRRKQRARKRLLGLAIRVVVYVGLLVLLVCGLQLRWAPSSVVLPLLILDHCWLFFYLGAYVQACCRGGVVDG